MEYSTFMYGTGIKYAAIDSVYDRTTDDVKNKTLKGFVNYWDWNRIEDNTGALADYLNSEGFAFRLEIKGNWSASNIPDAENQERMLNNMKEIVRQYYTVAVQLPDDMQPLDYLKLNDIEYIQVLLRYLMDLMVASRYYSGYLYSGGGNEL